MKALQRINDEQALGYMTLAQGIGPDQGNYEQGCWRRLEEGDRCGEAVQRIDGRALLVHGLVFRVGPDQAVQVAAFKFVRLLCGAQPAYLGRAPCRRGASRLPHALHCLAAFVTRLSRLRSLGEEHTQVATRTSHVA